MHGEAVAFGLVVQLRLERAPELEQVLEFCQRVGLPTTLEDLGLGEISDATCRVLQMRPLETSVIWPTSRPR